MGAASDNIGATFRSGHRAGAWASSAANFAPRARRYTCSGYTVTHSPTAVYAKLPRPAQGLLADLSNRGSPFMCSNPRFAVKSVKDLNRVCKGKTRPLTTARVCRQLLAPRLRALQYHGRNQRGSRASGIAARHDLCHRGHSLITVTRSAPRAGHRSGRCARSGSDRSKRSALMPGFRRSPKRGLPVYERFVVRLFARAPPAPITRDCTPDVKAIRSAYSNSSRASAPSRRHDAYAFRRCCRKISSNGEGGGREANVKGECERIITHQIEIQIRADIEDPVTADCGWMIRPDRDERAQR